MMQKLIHSSNGSELRRGIDAISGRKKRRSLGSVFCYPSTVTFFHGTRVS